MGASKKVVGLCLLAVVTVSPACSCSDAVDPGVGGDGSVTDGAPIAPPIPGLMGLRVEPPTATVIDDGVAPGETTMYRALGIFVAGERDVTTEVAWGLSDNRLGTIVDGGVTTAGIGGTTTVTAAAGTISATAELIVLLETAVVIPTAPPGAETMFPADTTGDVVGDMNGPRIIYPSHETMFPRNLERVLYQWQAGGALDLFEVHFQSAVANVRYYTGDLSLLPDAAGWRWLAETHAGSSLELTVRGLEIAAPGTVFRSQTITLYFSSSAVIGALYYWSTGAQGVMRATISSQLATKFYTDPAAGDNTCVSCHTVSRNGRRLAVGYGGERLREVTIPDEPGVPSRTVLIPPDPTMAGPDYGWGTFNPPADRLLYANAGVLTLLDADTGDVLIDPVPLPAGMSASFPDWSPDGTYVAMSYGDARYSNKNVQGSSLARLPVNADGTFGMPEVIVASTAADDTIYFPSYSPDSRWIAFARGTGRSKDNVTGVLYLVASDGSGAPIAITRLNERVRDQDGIVDIGNAMPTWAPSTEPGIFWLALSSLRAYGDVIPGGGRDQLWGAAIDPSLIGTSDASYAAFWMPFQEINEGNHRAFWAIDTEAVCPSDVELCGDMLDNDCDGLVDEVGCCLSSPEVCDDGIDNDCDGVVDEGCGCGTIEDCTNGIDDDCDGLIDGADEDCIII